MVVLSYGIGNKELQFRDAAAKARRSVQCIAKPHRLHARIS
jgi:hypothetical protein